MVIVRLRGGLGNQLFQYAAGRAIASRNQVPLRLEISDTFMRADRPYRLDRFNIVADIASAADMRRIYPAWRQPLLRLYRAVQRRCFGRAWQAVIHERGFAFDPTLLRLGGNTFIDGYWQSEKYFQSVASLIRRELTLRAALSAEAATLIARVAAVNSVSLHVRRGDYVSVPESAAIHGTMSRDYYAQAMALIAARVDAPHFFVFSDDPDWASANIHAAHPVTFVAHAGGRAEDEELMIMSRCRHHIIANSSFSWWGAWLNPAPDKVVIAPKRWFIADLDATDLVPERWLRI